MNNLINYLIIELIIELIESESHMAYMSTSK